MTVDIYYFSGTGNSLWVAREIAARLEARVIPIVDVLGREGFRAEAGTVGIVFPSYLAALWGVPLAVERFVALLAEGPPERLFAVCTCGGHESVNAVPTLLDLSRFARSRGLRVSAEYTVRLPMNNLDYEHIPVPIETDSAVTVRDAESQVDDICRRIATGRNGPHHLRRRVLVRALAPMFAAMHGTCMKSLRETAGEPDDSPLGFRELMPLTDHGIRLDEGCTGCGTCARVCPAGNIEIVAGRPAWRHRCEMCFACDEFCPRGAVHHWGRPNGAKYHHPSVTARDLYASVDAG